MIPATIDLAYLLCKKEHTLIESIEPLSVSYEPLKRKRGAVKEKFDRYEGKQLQSIAEIELQI